MPKWQTQPCKAGIRLFERQREQAIPPHRPDSPETPPRAAPFGYAQDRLGWSYSGLQLLPFIILMSFMVIKTIGYQLKTGQVGRLNLRLSRLKLVAKQFINIVLHQHPLLLYLCVELPYCLSIIHILARKPCLFIAIYCSLAFYYCHLRAVRNKLISPCYNLTMFMNCRR